MNELGPDLAQKLSMLSAFIHKKNVDAGWWEDRELKYASGLSLKDPLLLKYVVPTKLALAHSELSEALEGYRKGLMDDHLPHRPMIEVELADTIIRIMDLAGALGLDIGGALVEKFNYNQTRPDHKKETRAAEGGKKI